MSEGKLDKRFGSLAIDKGFITLEHLIEAMKIQILENLQGFDHRLIGQILWEEGYIKTEQINEVLKSMGI
jgi:aspartate 1-decarboxylase